jgi:four helix bundle protein
VGSNTGSTVRDYKELIAYQKSYELVLLVYRLTGSFPREEIYGLTSQIRRAAVSIPSNIAEGFMRGAKEYAQFLKIALGSTAEVETQLTISKDLGYCGTEDFENAHDLTKEVLRLLTSYITRVNNRVSISTKNKK